MKQETKKPVLYATSPDLAGIERSINKFFYRTVGWSVKEDLTILNPKGEVYTGFKIKVVTRKGVTRYRLESND